MKTKQIINANNQIIPKFKVGQELIDGAGNKLLIKRIYLNNKEISYDVKYNGIIDINNDTELFNKEFRFDENFLTEVSEVYFI